jgi:hypothetical protein
VRKGSAQRQRHEEQARESNDSDSHRTLARRQVDDALSADHANAVESGRGAKDGHSRGPAGEGAPVMNGQRKLFVLDDHARHRCQSARQHRHPGAHASGIRFAGTPGLQAVIPYHL